MTNTKTTKRALFASVLSLLLCASMLVGSTFAWFTDEASTSVNTIHAGNLKVDLVDEEGKSVVARTLAFKDLDNNGLWEPGCTYTLENVYVVNNGNLALEYEIIISGIDGNTGLLKVIEWTISGAEDGMLLPGAKSGAISITGHMDENAGNEYMGQTLEGIAITVKAYQTPYEKDSFTDQYDDPARPAEEIKNAAVVTAAELKTMLSNFTDAGSGNGVVSLSESIQLKEGETWTPIIVDGYNGAGVITVNGNGNTISGLNAPLFAGGFAGQSGIVINDLTIVDSNIVSTNTLGSGAFIETIDSMPTITLTNCHVKNSTITGSRTGGLIGWNSGYNNPNDGPVKTYVTIENCSVVNCTITGAGTVGGIVGHAGANAWTWNTLKNCKVENCTLTSNDDSYRVGAIVGTANVGEVVIESCTSTGNTITQNNNGTEITRPDGQSELFGRFVPGTTGKLTIDGTAVN